MESIFSARPPHASPRDLSFSWEMALRYQRRHTPCRVYATRSDGDRSSALNLFKRATACDENSEEEARAKRNGEFPK